ADEFGKKATAGLFHSMSAQAAMLQALAGKSDFAALVLVDPPDVPPPGHPVRGKMEEYEHKLARWARQRRTHFDDVVELARDYASTRSGQRWTDGAAEQMCAGGLAAGSGGRLAARLPDRTRSLDVSAGDRARAMAEAERLCNAREAGRRRSGEAVFGRDRAIEPSARRGRRVRLRRDPRHDASVAARRAGPLRRRRAQVPVRDRLRTVGRVEQSETRHPTLRRRSALSFRRLEHVEGV